MFSSLPAIVPHAAPPASDLGAGHVSAETRGAFAALMQQQAALRDTVHHGSDAAAGAGAPTARAEARAPARSPERASPLPEVDRRPAAQSLPNPTRRTADVARGAGHPGGATTAAQAAKAAPVRSPLRPAETAGSADESPPAEMPGGAPAAAASPASPALALAIDAVNLPPAAGDTAALSVLQHAAPVDTKSPGDGGNDPAAVPAWLQGQALVTGWRPAPIVAPATDTGADPSTVPDGLASIASGASPTGEPAQALRPDDGRPEPTTRPAQAIAMPPTAPAAADLGITPPDGGPTPGTTVPQSVPKPASAPPAMALPAMALPATALPAQRAEAARRAAAVTDSGLSTLAEHDEADASAEPLATDPPAPAGTAGLDTPTLAPPLPTAIALPQATKGDPTTASSGAAGTRAGRAAGVQAQADATGASAGGASADTGDGEAEPLRESAATAGPARPAAHPAATVDTAPPSSLAATSRRPSAEDGSSAKPSVSPVREPAAAQRDAATTAAALAPSAGAATTVALAGRATMQAANNARDAGNSLEPTRPTDSATTAAALPLPTAGGTLAGPVHGAGTAPTVAEAHLRVPLDSPDFAPALGGQITVFARDGVQTARLQLNPAEMGPITVQIALDGSAARVDFQADLAGTRTIIEASLPALAGALQDAGMTLAGGGVSQQSSGQRQPSEPPAAAALLGSGEPGAADNAQSAPTLQPARSRGLVDLVA